MRNNPSTRKTVTWILEDNVEELAKKPATPTEIEIASKIREMYDEIFEVMGMPAEIYLKNYAPHLRKYGSFDFSKIDPRWQKTIRWINELERKGDLIAYETDALFAFDRYVHGAAKKKYLKEGYDYLRKIAKDLPAGEKDVVMDFTDTMYGWSPVKGLTAKLITRTIKKAGGTEQEGRQLPISYIDSFMPAVLVCAHFR